MILMNRQLDDKVAKKMEHVFLIYGLKANTLKTKLISGRETVVQHP